MKIKKVAFKSGNKKWEYKDLELGMINLIVGKNASGKTTTLSSIIELLNFIIQKSQDSNSTPYLIGEYQLVLDDDGKIYEYEINSEFNKIKYEKLTVNNSVYFFRNSEGMGEILSEEKNEKTEFYIDENTSVFSAKKDKIHHPVLVKINEWCRSNMYCAFGSDLGKNKGTRERGINNIDDYYFTEVNSLVRNLKFSIEHTEYGEELKKELLSKMKELDYYIDDIGFKKYSEGLYGLQLKENGIDNEVSQLDMSQGMFRAFSLLTHSLINKCTNNNNLMIIDDIGEGLDFIRATKLIGLLISISEQSKTQLIMSTNDRHIMNNIPLEYWQVIDRQGSKIIFFSYKNHKDIFDEFKYTGLSNFDFLSTAFYKQSDE